jgi:hypothetical protein
MPVAQLIFRTLWMAGGAGVGGCIDCERVPSDAPASDPTGMNG